MQEVHGGMAIWHLAHGIVETSGTSITKSPKRNTCVERQDYKSCGLS